MDYKNRDYIRLLPFLRRYARALAGSAELADNLVLLSLKQLAEGPQAGELAPYRTLHALYDQGHYRHTETLESRHPLELALATLDEPARRIYLLSSLQNLTPQEVGEILGLTVREVNERQRQTRAKVHDQLIADIIIVEDDAIIAYDLSETVRAMGHTVCGTASTMAEALDVAAQCHPTLALMDIRLAAGDNGIEVAQALRRQRQLPLIFVTAFPDELERNGVAHLGPVIPKPFSRDQIEQAITRAVFTPTAA